MVGFGYDCGTIAAEKMKRADAAREFGIKTIHFAPFDGAPLRRWPCTAMEGASRPGPRKKAPSSNSTCWNKLEPESHEL